MRVAATAFLVVLLLDSAGWAEKAKDLPWRKGQLYGRELMTREERRAHWREWQALKTDEERDAYYRAHVERMEQRIRDRGVSEPVREPNLAGTGGKVTFWRAPYFQDIMTPEEQRAYRPTLDSIPDRMDRWRFVAKHIRTMYARAVERGISPAPTDEFSDVFEALGEIPPDIEDWLQHRQAMKDAGELPPRPQDADDSLAADADSDADEADAEEGGGRRGDEGYADEGYADEGYADEGYADGDS